MSTPETHGFDKIFSHEGIDYLRADAARFSTFAEYTAALKEDYQRTALGHRLQASASGITDYYYKTSIDQLKARGAFEAGGLLAMRLLSVFSAPETMTHAEANAEKIGLPDSGVMVHIDDKAVETADQLIAASLAQEQGYHSLLAEWEASFYSGRQPFAIREVERGFGLITGLAQDDTEAFLAAYQAQLDQEISATDWTELDNLLDNPQ